MPILDNIDQRIETELPKIQRVQDAQFQRLGRYYQVLPTHSQTPEDGNERTPDRLDRKPSKEDETPNEVAARLGVEIPSPNLANWHVNIYDGPVGKGYEVVFDHRIQGTLNRRTINSGPETWRSRGWREVIEEEV